MMRQKPTLKALLEANAGKQLLLLGKEGIFTPQEIARFLKVYKVTPTHELTPEVVGVVEHHQLNPVEEMVSESAYEQGLPLYKLLELEKLISQEIDDDALLMAVKLSNDQARVVRLLANEYLSDALFVKLLKLYRFGDVDEDSKEDRDVIVHTLRRYIAINPNEEDLLQSYLTLRRLATEATDPNLLEALMGFPNFSFLVRGKEKITLKETIARNPAVGKESVAKLLGLRDAKVNISLAGNPSVESEVLHHLATLKDEAVDKALATNPAIDDALFEQLLERGEAVVALLLVHQPLTQARWQKARAAICDESLLAYAGLNEQLEEGVKVQLLEAGSQPLWLMLAQNPTLTASDIETLWQEELEESFPALAANPATPVWILEALFDECSEEVAVLQGLGRNPRTPPAMLQALYNKGNIEINRALATNASLPDDILDELKLDTRLQTELAQNDRLAESFEAVLKQGKVMLNI